MAGVIWCSFKVSGDTRVASMRCKIRTFPSRVYCRACIAARAYHASKSEVRAERVSHTLFCTLTLI